MNVIETGYKGCRFRSRTEARWAVFFDAMGIPWEYEREGFDLGKHGLYLPDFWLSDWKVHLEVKGQPATEHEQEKCRALRDATGRAVLLVHGPIGREERTVFCWDLSDSSGGSSEWPFDFGMISHHPHDTPVFFISETNANRSHFADHAFQETITARWIQRFDDCGRYLRYELDAPKRYVEYAYESAKSARFEHGESPMVRR